MVVETSITRSSAHITKVAWTSVTRPTILQAKASNRRPHLAVYQLVTAAFVL